MQAALAGPEPAAASAAAPSEGPPQALEVAVEAVALRRLDLQARSLGQLEDAVEALQLWVAQLAADSGPVHVHQALEVALAAAAQRLDMGMQVGKQAGLCVRPLPQVDLVAHPRQALVQGQG